MDEGFRLRRMLDQLDGLCRAPLTYYSTLRSCGVLQPSKLRKGLLVVNFVYKFATVAGLS